MNIVSKKKKSYKKFVHISNCLSAFIVVYGFYLVFSGTDLEESISTLLLLTIFILLLLFGNIDFFKSRIEIYDDSIIRQGLFKKSIFLSEVSKLIVSKNQVIVFDKNTVIRINSEYENFDDIKSFIFEKVSKNHNIKIIEK